MPVLAPAPFPERRFHFRDDSRDDSAPLVWTVESFLSPAECAALIDRFEALGPAAAPVTTGGGFEMRPDIRNNSRVMFDDPELAASLFGKARPHLPDRMYTESLEPFSANERFRGYRYGPGERFASHYDGSFRRSAREESLFTFMVYLNEGFRGGSTEFSDFELTVVPRTGMALFFQHALRHEGCAVESGRKYVLRTDVMYRLAAS